MFGGDCIPFPIVRSRREFELGLQPEWQWITPKPLIKFIVRTTHVGLLGMLFDLNKEGSIALFFLPKIAIKQLALLHCLVMFVKPQLVYTATSKIGSRLLMASTSSNVQLGHGSEKTFSECLSSTSVTLYQVVATAFLSLSCVVGESRNGNDYPKAPNQVHSSHNAWRFVGDVVRFRQKGIHCTFFTKNSD